VAGGLQVRFTLAGRKRLHCFDSQGVLQKL
jgi:hypothetical protein